MGLTPIVLHKAVPGEKKERKTYYLQANVIFLESVSFNTTKQYRTDVSLVLEWFTYYSFNCRKQ